MSEIPPGKPKAAIRKANGEIDYAALAVLVLDDNAYFGRLVQQICRGADIDSVSVCSTPEEALSLLGTNCYDLVVADLLIGNSNGIDFVRRIRSSTDTGFQQIPIIMVTAHTDAENIHEMRDAGVTEILAKPISPAALLGRIDLVFAAPRQFVKHDEYTGPDRRRRRADYDGDERRGKIPPKE
ncbi:MAG: response regulator [Proteobacteria bacterium]|nr:response regulator [Pseudomonadota bacterium]